MVERLLQLFLVHLDPFSTQESQAVALREKLPLLVGRERFAVEHHADIEIQEPVETQFARRPAAELHLHLRPRRTAGRPPVGQRARRPPPLQSAAPL